MVPLLWGQTTVKSDKRLRAGYNRTRLDSSNLERTSLDPTIIVENFKCEIDLFNYDLINIKEKFNSDMLISF